MLELEKYCLCNHHFSFTCEVFATGHCHRWETGTEQLFWEFNKISDCNSLQNGKHIKSQTVKIIMKITSGMHILEECITQSVCGIHIYLLIHSNVTLAPTIAPAETRGSWQRKKAGCQHQAFQPSYSLHG